jgi:hypothetical protein
MPLTFLTTDQLAKLLGVPRHVIDSLLLKSKRLKHPETRVGSGHRVTYLWSPEDVETVRLAVANRRKPGAQPRKEVAHAG